jgi:transposase-like protein
MHLESHESQRTPRRVRADGLEWHAVVERYRQRGVTQSAFCQQVGIPVSTLQWWLTKARRAAQLPAPIRFVEVPRPPVVPAPTTSTWAWEIAVTRDGVTIRSREAAAVSTWARLLRHTGG